MTLFVQAKTNINSINEIFHHKGTLQQVELGKIVLYLSQKPIITTHLSNVGGMQELVICLPETTAAKKWLHFTGEQYDLDHTLLYTMSIRNTSNDKHAIELVIHYDTRRVVPEYALFDSISQQKGVVIIFHNKALLDRIKCNERGALCVACSNFPSVVIVDPGHGGHDCGALGATQVCEKDVVLDIGKHVVQLLSCNGITSYLTRKGDFFVPLDVRTTFANKHDALLVSIHANTSHRSEASGIETFYVHHTLLRENKVLDTVYSDVIGRLRVQLSNNSRVLADTIHAHIMHEVQNVCKESEGSVCNRGVKHSVGQVLLGTSYPSVIVEVGFLSHRKEELLLASEEYRKAAALGIAQGIMACISEQIQSF